MEVDKINLCIHEVAPFTNKQFSGFQISWGSDIGFGTYTIYKAAGSNTWCGESEHMDINEDKSFVKELFKLFIDQLEIVC
jgi:hypothetical protein